MGLPGWGTGFWGGGEGTPMRTVGIVVGWVGCGLLLVSLLLMLREPRLAHWLGGLERMYHWHRRTASWRMCWCSCIR